MAMEALTPDPEVSLAFCRPDSDRHRSFTMFDAETGQSVHIPDVGRLGEVDGEIVADAFVYNGDLEQESVSLTDIHEVILPERLGFGKNLLRFTERHKKELGIAAVGLTITIGASVPLRAIYRKRHQ